MQVSLEAEMSDALLWNEMGNLYLKIGSPEDAIAAYIKAIGLDPDSGMAILQSGPCIFSDRRIRPRPFLIPKKHSINGYT